MLDISEIPFYFPDVSKLTENVAKIPKQLLAVLLKLSI